MSDLIDKSRFLSDDLDALAGADGLDPMERILFVRLAKDAAVIANHLAMYRDVVEDLEYAREDIDRMRVVINELQSQLANEKMRAVNADSIENLMKQHNESYYNDLVKTGKLKEFISYTFGNQLIQAIKTLRVASGCGLKDGKDYAEAIRDSKPVFKDEIPF